MKSDIFVQKITFCFTLFVSWSSLKNASGSYCQKWAKNPQSGTICIFLLDQNIKNYFWFSILVENIQFYLIMSYWPIFWNMIKMYFSDLIKKEEVVFFPQKYYFSFPDRSILMSRRRCYSINPKHFCGRF